MNDITAETAAWLESRRVTIEPVPDDEIVGIGHALTHCRSLLGHLRHEGAAGIAPVRSVLLLGPAGTGKTLTARWLAGQLGPVPAYDLPAEQLTAERIRAVFGHLAAAPRAVVFLSEVDAIGLHRGDGDRESRAALFALLEALDGLAPVAPGHGPVVIATTNRDRRELDQALLRPGRLGTHIVFGLPSTGEREALYRRFAAPWAGNAGTVDWSRLADMTRGWTPAHIRGAVDDALGLALLRDGETPRLAEADLVAAARRGGVIEPDDERPFAELPQVALHEAGHVACAVALDVPVRSVHLGIGRRGGRTETGADDAVLTDHDLVAGVVVALGGVAAELVLSGAATAGSTNDVLRATELLIMRVEAGLDPGFPPVSRRAWGTTWATAPVDALLVPHAMAALEAAREQAREIVVREAVAIRRLADLLLTEPDLSGTSLDAALAAVGWRTPATDDQQEAA